MLSYRHSFHAGNHADVLKHIVLMLILENLKQKEKGFYYLDTHAGVGKYPLWRAEAQKNAEYETGIGKLWGRHHKHAVINQYLELIKKINHNKSELRDYAGSPWIAVEMLRSQDRALLVELHPSDFPLLKQNFRHYRNVQVKRDDGFQQVKATFPPKERRGLVLMDPPYELKEDYQQVVYTLMEGYKRFATGIYAIWYPVVSRSYIKKMCRHLESTGIRKILQIELAVRPDSEQRGMTASGMIVVNPPWQLESQMEQILPYLTQTLVPERTGDWILRWIVPE